MAIIGIVNNALFNPNNNILMGKAKTTNKNVSLKIEGEKNPKLENPKENATKNTIKFETNKNVEKDSKEKTDKNSKENLKEKRLDKFFVNLIDDYSNEKRKIETTLSGEEKEKKLASLEEKFNSDIEEFVKSYGFVDSDTDKLSKKST